MTGNGGRGENRIQDVFICVAVIKYPDKMQLREGGLILSSQFQVTVHHCGKYGQQELKAHAHITSTVQSGKKRTDACLSLLSWTSPLQALQSLTHQVVPLRVGLPTSVNPIKNNPSQTSSGPPLDNSSWRLLPWVILRASNQQSECNHYSEDLKEQII